MGEMKDRGDAPSMTGLASARYYVREKPDGHDDWSVMCSDPALGMSPYWVRAFNTKEKAEEYALQRNSRERGGW